MLRILSISMNVVVMYGIIYENVIILTSFKYVTYLIGGFSLLGYILTVILQNKDERLRKHLLNVSTFVPKYPLLNNIFTFLNILFICGLFGYEKVLFGFMWTFIYLLLPVLVKALAQNVYEKTLIVK